MATIITKFSSTSSAVPSASDLVQGELAVNTADKRLFTENNSAVIIELGTNPSSITTGAITATGTVTANSSLNSSNAVLTGGTVNGVVVGGSTPQAITGTLITANTNFAGALTGNVTGNVTGNLTGNVTGDLTGNVTASSGTTTLNNLVLNGTVDFNAAELTDLATPTADSSAATKGYVDTEVAGLVDSAPGTLDTLNELAAALGDDPDFATTITNEIATKLALAGGTMTGAIAMGTNKITGLGTPTASADAVNKTYADTMLPLAGGTMTGNIVLGSNKATSTATPSADDDLTRKGYVDGILGSATSAAASAATATTKASEASTSASNAATSASNASTSATSAAASYDSFDDRYLGAKSSDPTVDNDGDALIAGALYFNTSSNVMKVYSGSSWANVAPTATSVTVSQISDLTANATELNVLDGIPATLTATELGHVDGVTSAVQTQLNTLTTNVATNATAISNVSVTAGTQTKTYSAGETSTITLSGNVLSPVVAVTKEVAQTGVSNNSWDVNSSSENYTRYNSAPATTLTFAGLFDLSGASFVDSFDVSSQDTSPHGLAFNTDGTKMFIAGLQGLDINEYTLSSAFDVSTASFVDSFSVSSQDSAIRDVEFNADGTKMYVVGDSFNSIYQYSLSTAFDVSTASYNEVSFNVGSQETNPSGVAFNTDGTKMFVLGRSGDDVGEYALTTGFDISTASFTDSFSVAGQETGPEGIAFNTDGTKMFIVGEAGDDVNVYTLSTGFDVSSASYTSNFSISSQEADPTGIAFSASGDKMFIVGLAGDDVNEYEMPVTLALGSGSFASTDVGKTIEANSGVFILTSTAGAFTQTTAPTSFAQVASGSWEMYGVVFNTTDGDLELSGQVLLANLSSPSQVATLNLATGGANISAPSGIFINSAGTRLFVTDDGPNDVIQLNLSTAFDITTGSYANKYLGVGNRDSNPSGLWFSPTGHRMFIAGKNGNNLLQFSASSGNEFEINQYSFDGSFDISSQSGDAKGVVFNPAGTTMIIVDDTDNALYQYTLSTAFTVSSASYANKSFSVSSQISSAASMGISSDGTKIFVNDYSSETVFEYELTTGFDIATASYTGRSYAMSGQMSSSAHLFILPDDQSFISGENAASTVYEYSCASSNIPSGYHAAHTTTSTDSEYWTDINSMTADEAAGSGNIYYCVSTDDRTTWKVAKGTDGERSIVRNSSGTWQYNSNATYGSTTWANATTNAELAAIQEAMGSDGVGDIGNATYSSVNYSTGALQQRGISFSSDGTKMFLANASSTDQILRYTLSTAWDVTTASVDSGQTLSYGSQDNDATAFTLSADGTRLYVLGLQNKTVFQYIMTTAYDLTTASYNSVSLSVNSQDTVPFGITFNNDGTKLYIGGQTNDRIFAYNLTTGFDLSSASYSNVSLDISSQDSAIKSILFNSTGTKLYMFGTTTASGYQYSLTTAYDISTASYDSSSFDFSSQDGTPQGYAFKSDNTELFMIGDATDKVYKYSMISFVAITANQMNKTQLDAIPDANHFTLADDLDLAIIFNMSSGTTLPSSDGVAINYDANVLNKGAILGTDYDYDAPAQNKVRITSTNAANLKVRIV